MEPTNITSVVHYYENATHWHRKGTSLYTISMTTQTIMTAAYVASIVLSILGNSVGLLIVYRRSRKSFNITNVLIGNMAVADLLVTLFIMPQAVGYLFIQNKWFGGVAGKIVCKVAHFPDVMTISASILTILTISIERYCSVFYHLRNSVLRRSKLLTAIIWGLSSLLSSPFLFTYTLDKDTTGQHFCVVEKGGEKETYHFLRVYYTLIFIFLYATPLAFMSVLYTLIARKLWKKTVTGDGSIVTRKSATTAKRKVIKLLLALVVLFAVCSAPAHIMHYYMFYELHVWLQMPLVIKLLSFWVSQSNSAINPIVYILLSDSFRREFFRLALCKRRAIGIWSSSKSKRNLKMKATASTRLWLQAIKKDNCL